MLETKRAHLILAGGALPPKHPQPLICLICQVGVPEQAPVLKDTTLRERMMITHAFVKRSKIDVGRSPGELWPTLGRLMSPITSGLWTASWMHLGQNPSTNPPKIHPKPLQKRSYIKVWTHLWASWEHFGASWCVLGYLGGLLGRLLGGL